MKKLKRLSQRLAIKALDLLAKLSASLAVHMCGLSSWLFSLSNRLFERMWYQEAATSASANSAQEWQLTITWTPTESSETSTTPYDTPVESSPNKNDGQTGIPKHQAAPKPTKQRSKPRTRKSKGAKSRQKRVK